MMGKMTSPDNLDQVYERIRSILTEARNRAYQAINSAMVAAYWEISAWSKKGSGTVVRSTLRAVPATVPDPFLDLMTKTKNSRRIP